MPVNRTSLPGANSSLKSQVGDMDNTLLVRQATIEVSFETSEQGNNVLYFGSPATILSWRAVVTKALADTDAGTITLKNSAGSNITPNAVLSWPASTARATEANQTGLTTNNTVTADSFINFVTAKTTAGGKARVTVYYRITG